MYTVRFLSMSRRLSRQLFVQAGYGGYPHTPASSLEPLRVLRERMDSEDHLVTRNRRLQYRSGTAPFALENLVSTNGYTVEVP